MKFVSIALLGLVALACDRRDPPSGLTASSALAASRAMAVGEDAEEGCTLASLRGGYGFVRAGTSTAGPLATVGLTTYDGAGNWSATQSLSRNGAFTFDATASGTYVVNADCTGRVFSSGQEVARLAIVDRGRTVFQLNETAGNEVTEIQKKVKNGGCTVASLEGDYGFFRTGMTTAGPLAAGGLAHYDGAGSSSAIQTNIRNGIINPDVSVAPAPYEVSADCTGKLFFGGREIARFVVVDNGREVYQLSEAAGNTVTGVQRKVNRGHDED